MTTLKKLQHYVVYAKFGKRADEVCVTLKNLFGQHSDDRSMTLIAEGCWPDFDSAKAWRESLDWRWLLEMRLLRRQNKFDLRPKQERTRTYESLCGKNKRSSRHPPRRS